MSTFLAVGLAHHGTPLPQLERVAAGASARAELQAAALAAGCAEALVLSTCSRTELHVVLADAGDADADAGDAHAGAEAARDVAELLGKALTGHLAGPLGPL
nr:hypothetical protein [Actinomycetota bacterium]